MSGAVPSRNSSTTPLEHGDDAALPKHVDSAPVSLGRNSDAVIIAKAPQKKSPSVNTRATHSKPSLVERPYKVSRTIPLANVAYIYDGTTEGLLSAIFLAYERRENPQDVVREGAFQPRIDQSVIYVETNFQHAERVRKGIIRKSNRNAWEIILDASLSDDPQAGSKIHQLVRLIMKRQAANNQHIGDELANPMIGPVINLHRSVRNERHYMQQFIRFEHFAGDLWFARCNPKANVVPLLMDWFSARFNTQRFVIYDEVHNVAGVYDGNSWYLAETNDVHLPLHASEESAMQDAWKRFYDSVSIPARYHPELRRQFMPKRFWKNILEVRDEPLRTNRALNPSLLPIT